MNKNKLTVTGTGDALFVAPFPDNYDVEYKEVADYIKTCDVKITNLETNLTDFEYFGNAYSGGTWINTRREYLKYLKEYGFNFYGNANNHAMDYGHNGLLSTISTLEENGLAHAGTGDSLSSAEKPAILDIDGKKVAIFAVDASFEIASKAGNATKNLSARPGVNYLGHNDYFYVTDEEMEQLKSIAKNTKINFARERSIRTGFSNPDPDGQFMFAGNAFTTDKTKPSSECNKSDLNRILGGIKKAKEENDYVFIQVHCHNNDNVSQSNPPEYLKEFCRKCIDTGVSAVFGGGCHELRGIEIYKDKPIFYSLGDFIYQGLRVEYLPADFMEKFNADINLSAIEALHVRSRGNKVGLHLMKENFLTILPKIEFDGDKIVDLTIVPVSLNFDATDFKNGLPKMAKGAEEQEIIGVINELSAPFGTKFVFKNGAYRPIKV